MSYIQDVETEAREQLDAIAQAESDQEIEDKLEDLIKWFKEKILESYKNGVGAGKEPAKKGKQHWGRKNRD